MIIYLIVNELNDKRIPLIVPLVSFKRYSLFLLLFDLWPFEKDYFNKATSEEDVSGVYRLTDEHTPYMYTSVFLRCMCIDTREYSFSTELSDLLTRHTRLGTQRHVYVKFLGNGNTFLPGRIYVIYEARC